MRLSCATPLLLLALVNGCKQPTRPVNAGEAGPIAANAGDPCFLPQAAFGDTAEPMFREVPPPHVVNPADCPFYQPAWEEFLYATKPLPMSHLPAFLSYRSFQEIFANGANQKQRTDSPSDLMLTLEPRNIQRANTPSAAHQKLLDDSAAADSTPGPTQSFEDTIQAAVGKGVGGTLIDQQGHFIYYAIHANPRMVAFLRANKLTGPDVAARVSGAPPFVAMTSPSTKVPSLVEFKSAWMIVDDPAAASTYYVARAKVPYYVVDANGQIAPLRRGPKNRPVTREVWVAMLALHVVFTLPGHPEMIWSTFEHVSLDGDHWVRDNAPAATSNPDPKGALATLERPNGHYSLYMANTPAANCNSAATSADMVKHWDTDKQSFTKGGVLQTSVYRPYPGSKLSDVKEDDEVERINQNATARFDASDKRKLDGDKRKYYRLVGAIWMDKPAHFQVNMEIKNPVNVKPDDVANADVAGEDALGSTAMESFTEGLAPNCFACHDTQGINISHHPQMPPSSVNISHLMSKLVGLLPSP